MNDKLYMIPYFKTPAVKMIARLILLVGCIVFLGCKKKTKTDNDKESKSLPTLSAFEILSTSSSSVICSANVDSEGGNSLKSMGICWSTNPAPSINENTKTAGVSLGNFTLAITGLNSSTTYYFRAYATNQSGTSYSDEKIITTSTPKLYLGKYNHINGLGAYFQFSEENVVRYGGTAGYTDGTYSMLSATKVKVDIGSWGEGEFTNNFQTLSLASNTFTKE